MEKTKKIPERRCTGCNQSFPKKELLRIVRSPEGTVSLDLHGKMPGRGVYVCKNAACFKKACKGNRLAHALETEIPESVIEAIGNEIASMED